jgi:hypothetical protein
MIDAARLVAAHEQALRRAEVEAAANEPPPRQFPLAGRGQLRPLTDPARKNAEENNVADR